MELSYLATKLQKVGFYKKVTSQITVSKLNELQIEYHFQLMAKCHNSNAVNALFHLNTLQNTNELSDNFSEMMEKI